MLSEYQRLATFYYQQYFSYLPKLLVDWCLKSNRLTIPTKNPKRSISYLAFSAFFCSLYISCSILKISSLLLHSFKGNEIQWNDKTLRHLVLFLFTFPWIPVLQSYLLLSLNTTWFAGYNQLLVTQEVIERSYRKLSYIIPELTNENNF